MHVRELPGHPKKVLKRVFLFRDEGGISRQTPGARGFSITGTSTVVPFHWKNMAGRLLEEAAGGLRLPIRPCERELPRQQLMRSNDKQLNQLQRLEIPTVNSDMMDKELQN